jgi:hypothetical protein
MLFITVVCGAVFGIPLKTFGIPLKTKKRRLVNFNKMDKFSIIEKTSVMESHGWMDQYYGQLLGSVVDDISIAIDDKNSNAAFVQITFKLTSGRKVKTEIASITDENIPGIIYGLPWSEELFEKTPK